MVTPLYEPGLLKVDYAHQLGSREWHFIRWFLVNVTGFSGDIPLSNLNGYATAYQTAWTSHVFPFCTTDVTLLGTTVTDFTSATGGQATVSAGGTGADATPTLPVHIAAEIHYPISRRYRGGKPKNYLSGIGEPRMQTNTTWTSSFVSALESGVNAWLTQCNAHGETFGGSSRAADPVNYSRFSGHVERPSAQIDVISLSGNIVNPNISAQRRRRGRI